MTESLQYSELRPSLNRLRGKCAVVTGASKGIGLSIARVFAHEGAHVVIMDSDGPSASSAAEHMREKGLSASIATVDLLDKGMTEEAFAEIIGQRGKIDILVNNARTGKRSDVFTQDADSWDREMNLMVKSTFHLSQLLIKSLKGLNARGAILNISSVASFLCVPESPAYHAAKGGVESLTRYLATEAGKYGIRVNSLCPGHVLKAEQNNAQPKWKPMLEEIIPIGRVPTSLEIGYTALFICSDEASVITGQSILVDGGLHLYEQAYLLRRAGLDF